MIQFVSCMAAFCIRDVRDVAIIYSSIGVNGSICYTVRVNDQSINQNQSRVSNTFVVHLYLKG